MCSAAPDESEGRGVEGKDETVCLEGDRVGRDTTEDTAGDVMGRQLLKSGTSVAAGAARSAGNHLDGTFIARVVFNPSACIRALTGSMPPTMR